MTLDRFPIGRDWVGRNQHANEPIQDNIRFPSTEFYDYYIENHKTIRQETNTADVKNFIGRGFSKTVFQVDASHSIIESRSPFSFLRIDQERHPAVTQYLEQ